MATKRTPLSRDRKRVITPEMVELFRRGCDLQAAYPDEMCDGEGDHYREFLQISKRLDWEILHHVGEYSVFDSGGPPPPWLASARTWPQIQELRCALLATVAYASVTKQAGP